MKNLISSAVLILVFAVNANAQIYRSKEKLGKIHFFSSTPMENIEASTNTANSLLNPTNDTVKFSVTITSFKFPNSLMQEHFNENYLESEKFPKATLMGKINEKIDYKKDGVNKVTANCNVTMHGVTKLYTLAGTLTIKGDELHLVSKFDVKLVDHKIEVPKLVMQKISESISIDVDFTYAPFVKK